MTRRNKMKRKKKVTKKDFDEMVEQLFKKTDSPSNINISIWKHGKNEEVEWKFQAYAAGEAMEPGILISPVEESFGKFLKAFKEFIQGES